MAGKTAFIRGTGAGTGRASGQGLGPAVISTIAKSAASSAPVTVLPVRRNTARVAAQAPGRPASA
ncbi:hypothetical protein AB0D38_33315 [Streptomyces sp. NPDC048279]|uniref:hypothetical protein n=1 Tax=Streptomyces sp. NPDC048279 TaxID=3154714 RepID=UPI003413DBA8